MEISRILNTLGTYFEFLPQKINSVRSVIKRNNSALLRLTEVADKFHSSGASVKISCMKMKFPSAVGQVCPVTEVMVFAFL